MPVPSFPTLFPTQRPHSRRWPVGHLLNPATPYVPACQTNIRATFDRVRADFLRRDR